MKTNQLSKGKQNRVRSATNHASATFFTRKKGFMLWFFLLVAPLTVRAQFAGGNGTSGSPYLISTAAQLAQLATYVNAGTAPYANVGVYYRLNNDINLNVAPYNSGTGWTPIGNGIDNRFKGVFDGNNKIITNLYINSTNLQDVGLFGRVGGGTIKNLGVENVNIFAAFSRGEDWVLAVGGILGSLDPTFEPSDPGNVTNCYSTGIIRASVTNSSESFTGGVVGWNRRSVTNCYSTASVSSSSSDSFSTAGGVVGASDYGCVLSCCYSTGSVSSSAPYSQAGGVLGGEFFGTTSNCTALNTSISCTGAEIYFGRIAGSNYSGTLTNNIAFIDILNPYDGYWWNYKGASQKDGADITAQTINSDGTLGGRFTSANGWTTQNGKLPGLFGNTVDMPEHLRIYSITVSATPSGGGTISGGGIYEHDEYVIVTASANAGYRFVNWTENGTQVSTNASYDFFATASRNLVANFQNVYTISVSANPAAGGSVSGGGNYNQDTGVTVTAIPNAAYNFDGWREGSTTVSTSLSYNFNATANRTLVANFSLKTYQIAISASPTNGGNVTGGGTYNHGGSVTVTATPATGYSFVNWTEGGSSVSTNTSYTFTASAGRTLVANFVQKTYNITASAEPTAGGGVSGGGNNITHGSSVTVIASPNAGYNFVNWTENGNQQSTNTSYTFAAENNRSLVAHFSLRSYVIGVSALPMAGGSVSGGGTYNHNAGVTVKATANTGYDFVNWTEGVTQVSAIPEYPFTAEVARTLVANFALKNYVIAASANPAEGSVSGGGSYKHFDNVTLVATANTGYDFVNWTAGGAEVSTAASYTFTAEGARTLVANFVRKTYTVSVLANPPEGGLVLGGGTVSHGNNATVTASENDHYDFLYWTYTGGQSAENPYTFPVTADVTLTANFRQLGNFVVSVVVHPDGAGSVTGEGAYMERSKVTLEASASEAYNFVNWTETGVEVETNRNYIFTIEDDVILNANFAIKTYTITASVDGGNGVISPVGNVAAEHGADQTFIITPATGYHISEVLIDGFNHPAAVAGGYYIFENVTANGHTIVAKFAIDTYIITASVKGVGGVIDPDGGVSVNHSANRSFTITPATGYRVALVLADDAPVTSVAETGGTYTFENVTANHKIEVTFALKTYTIMASVTGGNGTVTPGGTSNVNHGENLQYTITPNSGYRIAQLLVDGNPVAIPENGVYAFTDVTANRTINASFALNTYTITASVNGDNGTITPAGATIVNHGGSQAYSITPVTGYKIAQVLIDDDNNSVAVTSGNYTFTNVTGNHTIVVSFDIITFSITALVDGGNGSITPPGVTNVSYGMNQSYAITPNPGYRIAQVMVNNVNNLAAVVNEGYTFTNVTGDQTIIASFTANALTGAATISNTSPRIGDELTGSLTGSNPAGALTYTWKADNVMIPGITGNTYTVAVGDFGKAITLEITSDIETGVRVSNATYPVMKKTAPAAPAAPTSASKTNVSITLTAVFGHEYFMIGATDWLSQNTFTNLTPNTEYTFFQRIAATNDTEASEVSEALSVTTNATSVATFTVTVSSIATDATGSGNYEQGAAVSIKAGTPPEGYQFKNWTTTSAGVSFANANIPTTTFPMPDNPVTVTANFEAITGQTYLVTVSSPGVGPTGGGNFEEGAVVYINAGTDPPGLQFKNWTTPSQGVNFILATSRMTSFIMPARDVTVLAVFEEKSVPVYSVTFDTQDGSPKLLYFNQPEGETIRKPANPTRSGYDFEGWFRDKECTDPWDFDSDGLTEDLILYAKWRQRPTSAEELQSMELNVFPNPFTVELRIITDAETWRAASLQVINAAGAVVHTQILSGSIEMLLLEHLPAGVYYIFFEKDGKTKTLKVVKE